jgi:hypothetical protein
MSNGLSSMGIALPGAGAAALEQPGRRVVAAMWDGGFLMNSQELETARRLGVAFTVRVFNDNDHGLISWKQRMHGGWSTGTQITNPDFKKYAESFGIKAYSPRSLEQLSSDLKLALNRKELSVVDIPIDHRVGDQLVKRLRNGCPQGWTMPKGRWAAARPGNRPCWRGDPSGVDCRRRSAATWDTPDLFRMLFPRENRLCHSNRSIQQPAS